MSVALLSAILAVNALLIGLVLWIARGAIADRRRLALLSLAVVVLLIAAGIGVTLGWWRPVAILAIAVIGFAAWSVAGNSRFLRSDENHRDAGGKRQ